MKYSKLILAFFGFAAMTAAGCDEGGENARHYVNKVYISSDGYTQEIRIAEGDTTISQELVVGMAAPEDRDVTVSFRAAPELLDTYREGYYDERIQLLPDTHYDFAGLVASIGAGRVSGDPLTLEFVGLDNLDFSARYVLPVTISSAAGVEILQSARTLYYIFQEASLVNVAANVNRNWAWPDWRDASPVANLQAFTLETLVMGYAFDNESSISTIMGIEDRFLIRVGDVQIPGNQIQIAYGVQDDAGVVTRGNVTGSSLALQVGVWYHVAVTFDAGIITVYIDGVARASGDSSGIGLTSVDFSVEHSDEADGKPRCFWIGYSYDANRYLNGLISETRIWNRALTAEEIAAPNHFYQVDPGSDGLAAYWKFDEGEGNVVADHTRYGNELTTNSALSWVAVALPEREY